MNDVNANVMIDVTMLNRIADLEHELAKYRRSHLRELMRDMSETAYCAGWLIGLEFNLWSIIIGTWDYPKFGMHPVSSFATEIADLKRLSAAVNGWWIWQQGVGETFISMDEWLPMFEKGSTR